MRYYDEDGEEISAYTLERIETQYFIDTEGKEHRWAGTIKEADRYSSLHYGIAEKLFPKVDVPDDYVMDKLGWVMMGSSVYTTPIIHKKPTQAQIDKLFDLGKLDRLCFLYDHSYPNWEKYKILCT